LGLHKKDLEALPLNAQLVAAGLGRTIASKISTWGLHVCAGELDILKIYI